MMLPSSSSEGGLEPTSRVVTGPHLPSGPTRDLSGQPDRGNVGPTLPRFAGGAACRTPMRSRRSYAARPPSRTRPESPVAIVALVVALVSGGAEGADVPKWTIHVTDHQGRRVATHRLTPPEITTLVVGTSGWKCHLSRLGDIDSGTPKDSEVGLLVSCNQEPARFYFSMDGSRDELLYLRRLRTERWWRLDIMPPRSATGTVRHDRLLKPPHAATQPKVIVSGRVSAPDHRCLDLAPRAARTFPVRVPVGNQMWDVELATTASKVSAHDGELGLFVASTGGSEWLRPTRDGITHTTCTRHVHRKTGACCVYLRVRPLP